jgi:hypothetical protein
MQIVAKAADWLLSTVVPQVTADACSSCNGLRYERECYCSGGSLYLQWCVRGCLCQATDCGACFITAISC